MTAFNLNANAQTYVFAQLTGSPVNTTGWRLYGSAAVTNVTGTGNSEVRLVPVTTQSSGSVYYGKPLNANLCKRWAVEFDFRIFDGSKADGLAFWYLDVPPTGFVNGSGLGIPGSANGLKVGFDTYNNCGGSTTQDMPKIELRWGTGYSECWAQPTASNVFGMLDFVRSNTYNHAKITYDNGAIVVYVNGTQYLTGNYTLTFPGYLGFSASVGDQNDNHSIKNAIIYTDIPPSFAGSDTTLCHATTLQLGDTTNPNFSYSWANTAGLSSTSISNPSINLSNYGVNPIIKTFIVNTSLIGSVGCSSSDTMIVKVMPASRGNIIQTICAGQSFLGHDTTGVYNDTLLTAQGCDSIRTINLTVLPILRSIVNQTICAGQSFLGYDSTGTYLDTLSNANGCDSIRTLNLTVTPRSVGNISQSICEGTAYLGYTTAGIYTDTLAAAASTGCDSIRILDLSIIPRTFSDISQTICQGDSYLGHSSTGTYVDTIVSASGCDSIRTLHLMVQSTLTSSVNQVICQGESYMGYSTQGVYIDTFPSSRGCDSIRTLNLIVIPNPNPTFTLSPTSGCPPLTVTFTNTTPSASGITYTWDFGQPGTQSQPTATHTYYQSGSYPVSLSATNSNGCSAVANASNTITVFDMPQAAFNTSPNPNTFGNSLIRFSDNSTGAATWQWNFGDGLGTSNQQNPSYSYPNAGDYQVMLIVTTNNGCKDTAYQNLTVYPLNDIFIPNAFSPNGDGLNETFGIFGMGLRDVQLYVYNRYGNQVFHGNGSYDRWNGKMKGTGKKCDSGTYTYYFKAIDSNGKSRTIKGTVLLIR